MNFVQKTSSRPKLQMMHPKYPKIQIPAARVIGIGRVPAVPAINLSPGDAIVHDYGKIYRLQKIVPFTAKRIKLYMNRNDDEIRRTVSPNAHVAVSWGTFNKYWTAPKITGGKRIMAKKNPNLKGKVNLGRNIDLRTPINSGVSFNGRVDLTKQGRVKRPKY